MERILTFNSVTLYYIIQSLYTFLKQPLEVLCKKGVLRNFTKSTGKHLCQSARVFSCEFCEISKNTFFTEHLWTTAPNLLVNWILIPLDCNYW